MKLTKKQGKVYAINIRNEGLRILTSGTGDSAYCLAVRQGSKGRKSSTVLQATG